MTDVQEISGHGIIAKVDGHEVAIGNEKLMSEINVLFHPCSHIGTIIHVALDGDYAGHIVISDELKSTSRKAMAELKKVGVEQTVMLTGDAKSVAEKVAKEVGISDYRAELLPADKVLVVEKLLSECDSKKKLAFVGDGINDAPVLSRADIELRWARLGQMLQSKQQISS